MKKKSTGKAFKTAREMDHYLETHDLGEFFVARGKVIKSKTKKINLDLPDPVVHQVDEVAAKIGIARQPLLKMWIHERLKKELTP